MFYSGLKSAVSFNCQPFSENGRGYFYAYKSHVEKTNNRSEQLKKLPTTGKTLWKKCESTDLAFYEEYKISRIRPARF
jgi:hypothetical protein